MSTSIFTDLYVKEPAKNVFDLSHNAKTTLKMGNLVPVLCTEVLPADTWKIKVAQMTRFLPMVAPIMQDVDVYFHKFFVPNRLLWSNWEDFVRGPNSENDNLEHALPILNDGGVTMPHGYSTLGNYLGLPANIMDGFSISALPFAAYQRIWFDYYRDQNLNKDPNGDLWNKFPMLTNGQQTQEMSDFLTTMRKRAWEHDYFTSALPFAQKGEPVKIPIIASGNVELAGAPYANAGQFIESATGNPLNASDKLLTDSVGTLYGQDGLGNTDTGIYDPNGTLKAIIDNVATTIKDLRTAEALQKFLELNARAGNRYFEYLHAVFGQRSPDSRLQRAEYIGGTKATMSISEVLQTSETANTPLGDFAGHGVSVSAGDDSTYQAQEHGYIIVLMSVRPKTSYFQGLPRHFRRFDRFDYAIPQFAHIGEQEVKNYELYCEVGNVTPTPEWLEDTFGYLPRYAEYKHLQNRISGDFADPKKLMYWHQGRYFDRQPALNEEFITCTPSERIYAVYDPVNPDAMEDYILSDLYFDLQVSRVLPRFDVPSLT